MGKYLLDTCIWIEWFKNRNNIAEHIRAVGRKNVYASEITLAELTFGAYNSNDFERHIQEPENLQKVTTILRIGDVFHEYAQIRCALRQQKKSLDKEIGNFDILIGATALRYGLTVVTDNVKHFELMPGVKVENWVERG